MSLIRTISYFFGQCHTLFGQCNDFSYIHLYCDQTSSDISSLFILTHQGMLDLALLASNASQLKYLMQVKCKALQWYIYIIIN